MKRPPDHAKLLTVALSDAMPSLAAYFQRRVHPDDAPDLLGETLVIAWRRVADLPDDAEGARMWLFGVARGTLLNHARGERRRFALVDRLRAGMSWRQPEQADDGADVRDAVSRLDDDLAEIVRLVHWDGFTLPDVARILDTSLTTVRSRYRRAREILRTALQADEGADSRLSGGAVVTSTAEQ